jgi:hypothetical protein
VPGNWPQWHPASLRVWGVTSRTLQVGESCYEDYAMAGRHGMCEWIARECVPGRRWVIETDKIAGFSATISYTLDPLGDFTRYERVFRYRLPNPLLAPFDFLILRRRIRKESDEATQRLKERLEN